MTEKESVMDYIRRANEITKCSDPTNTDIRELVVALMLQLESMRPSA